MTSLQIKYFLEVAECLSFSGAARKLYIAQPSISRHIRLLEIELNATLFDRTGRSLKLTHVGELYRALFTEVIHRIDDIKRENQEYLKTLAGEVKIAILSSMNTSDYLFDVLDSCAEKHPNINLNISFLSFAEIEEALFTGRADLIIHLRDFLHKTNEMVVQKLTDMPKAVFYHEALQPSSNKLLRPEDFKDIPFLVLDPAEFPLVEPEVVKYCKESGFTPAIRHVPNIESMIGGVLHKQGVAIFDTMMTFDSSKIRSIPMKTPHEVILAWSKSNNTQSVHIIANELLFHFRNKQDG